MNSKNISKAERKHFEAIKSMDCVICDAPGPSEAHHIEQGLHWTCMPLCPDCHRGGGGIHGTKTLWNVRKMTELSALNETLRRLFDGRA